MNHQIAAVAENLNPL